MADWTDSLQVFCTDIGSIAQAVVYQLKQEHPVTLGFEMPLFVPVPVKSSRLGTRTLMRRSARSRSQPQPHCGPGGIYHLASCDPPVCLSAPDTPPAHNRGNNVNASHAWFSPRSGSQPSGDAGNLVVLSRSKRLLAETPAYRTKQKPKTVGC